MQSAPPWRAKLAPAVVLLAAAALGLPPPLLHALRASAPFAIDAAGVADARYASARTLLAPGERVGLFLLSGDEGGDMAQWYAAQYALVPAVVEPLYMFECLRTVAAQRCRLDAVDRFVSHDDPLLLSTLRTRFGLVPLETAGETILLGRKVR